MGNVVNEDHEIQADDYALDDAEEGMFEPQEVLRIEGTLTPSWMGVSSCCRQSRVNDEARRAFSTWVRAKVKLHPGRAYRAGPSGKWTGRCRKSHNGARNCYASLKMLVFIEFL